MNLPCWVCKKDIEVDVYQSTNPQGPSWVRTSGEVRVALVMHIPKDDLSEASATMIATCSDTCFEMEQTLAMKEAAEA